MKLPSIKPPNMVLSGINTSFVFYNKDKLNKIRPDASVLMMSGLSYLPRNNNKIYRLDIQNGDKIVVLASERNFKGFLGALFNIGKNRGVGVIQKHHLNDMSPNMQFLDGFSEASVDKKYGDVIDLLLKK